MKDKELAPTSASPLFGHELPAELRALAAVVVNMLARHTHEQRVAVLRFALEKEKYIPVAKSSVFSGTTIMPEE
jgi:hypothetical protein